MLLMKRKYLSKNIFKIYYFKCPSSTRLFRVFSLRLGEWVRNVMLVNVQAAASRRHYYRCCHRRCYHRRYHRRCYHRHHFLITIGYLQRTVIDTKDTSTAVRRRKHNKRCYHNDITTSKRTANIPSLPPSLCVVYTGCRLTHLSGRIRFSVSCHLLIYISVLCVRVLRLLLVLP